MFARPMALLTDARLSSGDNHKDCLAEATCSAGTTWKVVLLASALRNASVALAVCSEPLVLFFTLSTSRTLPDCTPSALSIFVSNGETVAVQSILANFGG